MSPRFEIHSLVELFRQALLVVGPLAEKAGVAWLQEPPYDDWETIADGIFDGFVRSAILNSHGLEQLSLVRYGFSPEEGEAFIASEDGPAFLRFAGADPSLATVVFVHRETGHYETRRWDDLKLVLRLPDASHITILHVDQ